MHVDASASRLQGADARITEFEHLGGGSITVEEAGQATAMLDKGEVVDDDVSEGLKELEGREWAVQERKRQLQSYEQQLKERERELIAREEAQELRSESLLRALEAEVQLEKESSKNQLLLKQLQQMEAELQRKAQDEEGENSEDEHEEEGDDDHLDEDHEEHENHEELEEHERHEEYEDDEHEDEEPEHDDEDRCIDKVLKCMARCLGIKAPANSPNTAKTLVLPSKPSDPHRLIFFGNPGAGKSTLLNCLLGKAKFSAGTGFGEGVTLEMQEEKSPNGVTYVDTPGLSDVKNRKKGAQQCTKALRRGGKCKIVFLFDDNHCRIRADDRTTMGLILEAAEEIGANYGVIFNQCGKGLITRTQDLQWKTDFEALVMAVVDQKTKHFYYFPEDDALNDEEDKTVPLDPAFREFIQNVPTVDLHKANVKPVRAEDFEEMQKLLEKRRNHEQEKDVYSRGKKIQKEEEERRREEERKKELDRKNGCLLLKAIFAFSVGMVILSMTIQYYVPGGVVPQRIGNRDIEVNVFMSIFLSLYLIYCLYATWSVLWGLWGDTPVKEDTDNFSVAGRQFLFNVFYVQVWHVFSLSNGTTLLSATWSSWQLFHQYGLTWYSVLWAVTTVFAIGLFVCYLRDKVSFVRAQLYQLVYVHDIHMVIGFWKIFDGNTNQSLPATLLFSSLFSILALIQGAGKIAKNLSSASGSKFHNFFKQSNVAYWTQQIDKCPEYDIAALFAKLPEKIKQDPGLGQKCVQKCDGQKIPELYKELPAEIKKKSAVVVSSIERCHQTDIPNLFNQFPEDIKKDAEIRRQCTQKYGSELPDLRRPDIHYDPKKDEVSFNDGLVTLYNKLKSKNISTKTLFRDLDSGDTGRIDKHTFEIWLRDHDLGEWWDLFGLLIWSIFDEEDTGEIDLAHFSAAMDHAEQAYDQKMQDEAMYRASTTMKATTKKNMNSEEAQAPPAAVVWEAERRLPIVGFSYQYLHEWDPPRFADGNGEEIDSIPRTLLEDNVRYKLHWQVVVNDSTDENGWSYAWKFDSEVWTNSCETTQSWVRRRTRLGWRQGKLVEEPVERQISGKSSLTEPLLDKA